MPFSAKAVANDFLSLAKECGEKLSPMKLQKLVYFAHGWYLALTSEPLLNERIEAWQYGPVVPDLYHAFKQYGNSAITECAVDWTMEGGKFKVNEPRIEMGDSSSGDRALSILRRVWDVYSQYTAIQLSNATHAEGTPWKQVYRDDSSSIVIPDELIKQWFDALKLRNEARNATT